LRVKSRNACFEDHLNDVWDYLGWQSGTGIIEMGHTMPTIFRKTTQTLAPAQHTPLPAGQYDIYPGFDIGAGKIDAGYDALAHTLSKHAIVILDGFGGVLWKDARSKLDAAFAALNKTVAWHNIDDALKGSPEIDALIAPFLGGDDPIFGTRYTGAFADFFDKDALSAINPDIDAEINIVYGCGAALCGWHGALVYLDVPKNEIQFRARAGSIANLGAVAGFDAKAMYKRFYFVDWPALSAHKQALLPRIDMMVDAQRPDEPLCIAGDDLRKALTAMSQNFFRVRPWFEPGPWGGQWIKQHMQQLPQDAPNYAWSFELIVPENGLTVTSDGWMLEVSFDCLMFHAHEAVLGKGAARFGTEFPIRFDFLDTFDGGNLSVQCHPRPAYARKHFGENFTQDETYYILDCADDAQVYLGFREDIDPPAFRAALDKSFHEATPVDVERFVNIEPARKHDLFLIPNGTIHCSGKNNLVLEISATPYIFTFKMYDWMRLDLDGRPRPLNIARAFDNLYFDRKGERIRREFVSQPRVIAQGDGWQIEHVPTHAEHFYDVERLTFNNSIVVDTMDSVQVMSLVEGAAVELTTANGLKHTFSFAETFVVPAATDRFTFKNLDETPAMVVKCFLK
jgi:mannose-6-phosphate isomerase class I